MYSRLTHIKLVHFLIFWNTTSQRVRLIIVNVSSWISYITGSECGGCGQINHHCVLDASLRIPLWHAGWLITTQTGAFLSHHHPISSSLHHLQHSSLHQLQQLTTIRLHLDTTKAIIRSSAINLPHWSYKQNWTRLQYCQRFRLMITSLKQYNSQTLCLRLKFTYIKIQTTCK